MTLLESMSGLFTTSPAKTADNFSVQRLFLSWTGYFTVDCIEAVLSQSRLNLTTVSINQNVFIKPFLHQLISQNAVQKPSLKPQTASNAGVEARWLGKTP